MEEIGGTLEEQVNKKATIPAISEAATQAVYLNVLHKSAVKLAGKQSKLSEENQQLRTASSHLNFIAEFLASVNSADSPIDIAENFAVRWQKFYQTGMVCLYLVPPGGFERNRGRARRESLAKQGRYAGGRGGFTGRARRS